jgi:hypothetical protein
MRTVIVTTGLVLLMAAVLVILYGPSLGFPVVENFQGGFLSGLPDWALLLIFMGAGLGILLLWFGGRETYYHYERKKVYHGMEPEGIFEFMNPPLSGSPARSKSKSRSRSKTLSARPKTPYKVGTKQSRSRRSKSLSAVNKNYDKRYRNYMGI